MFGLLWLLPGCLSSCDPLNSSQQQKWFRLISCLQCFQVTAKYIIDWELQWLLFPLKPWDVFTFFSQSPSPYFLNTNTKCITTWLCLLSVVFVLSSVQQSSCVSRFRSNEKIMLLLKISSVRHLRKLSILWWWNFHGLHCKSDRVVILV